jgi:hypothetical protein
VLDRGAVQDVQAGRQAPAERAAVHVDAVRVADGLQAPAAVAVVEREVVQLAGVEAAQRQDTYGPRAGTTPR